MHFWDKDLIYEMTVTGFDILLIEKRERNRKRKIRQDNVG